MEDVYPRRPSIPGLYPDLNFESHSNTKQHHLLPSYSSLPQIKSPFSPPASPPPPVLNDVVPSISDPDRHLIADFAELLRFRNDNYLADNGLLDQYAESCETVVKSCKLGHLNVTESQFCQLTLFQNEAQTWRLLRRLITLWQTPNDPSVVLINTPYFSKFASALATLANDDESVELDLVKEWLESSFRHISDETRDIIIYKTSNLTPDYIPGYDHLCAKDPKTEPFFATVLRILQAGSVDYACKYAMQCNRPWVATSLAGSRLHDIQLNDKQTDFVSVVGNSSRPLWKAMCRSLARNPEAGAYEKAVYSLLSGYVEGVLPVCLTYETALHALVYCACDARVTREFGHENDLFPDQSTVSENNDLVGLHMDHTARSDIDLSRLTLSDIFEALELGKLSGTVHIHVDAVNGRAQFHPNVHAQLLLNSQSPASLIHWLIANCNSSQNVNHRRFAVHALLALRGLQLAPSEDDTLDRALLKVIQGYTSDLQRAGQLLSAIPVYMSTFPFEKRWNTMAATLCHPAATVDEWSDVFDVMVAMKPMFDVFSVSVEIVFLIGDRILNRLLDGRSDTTAGDGEDWDLLCEGVQRMVGYGPSMESVDFCHPGDNYTAMQREVLMKALSHVLRIIILGTKWGVAKIVADLLSTVVHDHDEDGDSNPLVQHRYKLRDHLMLVQFILRTPTIMNETQDFSTDGVHYQSDWVDQGLDILESRYLWEDDASIDLHQDNQLLGHSSHARNNQDIPHIRSKWVPTIISELASAISQSEQEGQAHALLQTLPMHQDVLITNAQSLVNIQPLVQCSKICADALIMSESRGWMAPQRRALLGDDEGAFRRPSSIHKRGPPLQKPKSPQQKRQERQQAAAAAVRRSARLAKLG